MAFWGISMNLNISLLKQLIREMYKEKTPARIVHTVRHKDEKEVPPTKDQKQTKESTEIIPEEDEMLDTSDLVTVGDETNLKLDDLLSKLEDIDTSIDYLTATVSGEDPSEIARLQKAYGRAHMPGRKASPITTTPMTSVKVDEHKESIAMKITKLELKKIIAEESAKMQQEGWFGNLFGKKKKPAKAAAPEPEAPTEPEKPAWDVMAAYDFAKGVEDNVVTLARLLDRSYDLIDGGYCLEGETDKCSSIYKDFGESFWRMLNMGKAGGWQGAHKKILDAIKPKMRTAQDKHDMEGLQSVATQVQDWIDRAAYIADDPQARQIRQDAADKVKDFQDYIASRGRNSDHLLGRHESKKLNLSHLQQIVKEEVAKLNEEK